MGRSYFTCNSSSFHWQLSRDHGGANSVISGVKNSLFLPASLPGNVTMPSGISARALRSNYTFGPVGNIFFGSDGSLNVFTSSPNRKRLAKIETDGTSSQVAVSDILAGKNFRAGAHYGNGFVVAVDYAPDTGNQLSGIYVLNSDGTYSQWALSNGHGGISDLIPAPQGGYYFTDFENDNLWHITVPGEPETGILKNSPAALMSVAASDTEVYAVNWIPGEWWSNGGVNAIYRIVGDSASQVVLAPEGSQLFSIAASNGGIFGSFFYVTDNKGGKVYRLENDQTLTPIITGLTNPGRIKFDPVSGSMVVVCDEQYILWFGQNLTPFQAQPESDGLLKGLFFSDFENDNIWFVPGQGQAEIPIVESNILPGPGTISYNDQNDTIYALNWQGTGWPFGGEDSVYAIEPNGVARQVIKGNYSSIAMSRGGAFGHALYLSEPSSGRILRLDENGNLAETVSGLSLPGPLSFDPLTGNMVVICDEGKSIVWIGSNLMPAAAGNPGTVGDFFVPEEQQFFSQGKNTIVGKHVRLEMPDTATGGFSAVGKPALSGDFEITASIKMSDKSLVTGQNRSAVFYVISDVAGQSSKQLAYAGIYQKTVGYASTGGQYYAYTDMMVNGSWGRFSNRPMTGKPAGIFKIKRTDGLISTYLFENNDWVKISTATDGFTDRVRIYFSIDTSWDASLPVSHAAVFNASGVFLGDADNDNDVDLADLIAILQVLSGSSQLQTDLIRSDIVKDGKAGLPDAVRLLQCLGGIFDQPCP